MNCGIHNTAVKTRCGWAGFELDMSPRVATRHARVRAPRRAGSTSGDLFSRRIIFFRWFKRLLPTALSAAVLLAQTATADSDPRLSEAAGLIEDGSLNRAVSLINQVVRDRPEDAEAHLLLGSALSMVPRRNEAVEALLRALELRPYHAPGYTAAGAALARLGEQDAALQVFERAVALAPDLGEAHLHLALLLAGKEEVDRAAEHMTKALELEMDDGKRARLHLLNGKLYAERERLEEAARAFEQAIALDPRQGEAHLALGVTRKKLMLEDEAYPMLAKAVELAPGDATAHYQLALELMRRGDSQAATKHLLKAHELRPDEQSIVYNLTRALHKSGRKEESARYGKKLRRMTQAADKARENALKSARLHGTAVRLEKSGDYAAALNQYRAVLEFEPLHVVARRNMALVLCRLNRWDEGIEELQAILRADPNDAETSRALTIALDQAARATSGGNIEIQ